MSFLVISVDDLAAFVMLKSLYAGTVHTPNIDRLMSMGTTFENGFSQVALCNPSRTSAMSGLSPAHTGVHHNTIEYWSAVQPEQLLFSHFMNAGYHTSVIGKVMHSLRVPEDYSARFTDFIFEDRTGIRFNDIGVMDESERSSNGDEVNVAQALQLLGSYQAGDPFAMFVGINKPHLNWIVPQEFYDLYPLEDIVEMADPSQDLLDLLANGLLMTGERRWEIDPSDAGPEAIQAYLAAISYADHLVGQLLDQLDASGLSDSTTIVLWTDHGYHLGDKDQWGKFTLWDTAARAPFIIALPGERDDGQVVSQVVELTDLMPTMLDLAGLPVPDGLDGRSLVEFIDNPDLIDDAAAVTSMNGHVSLRTNEWRIIRYTDGELELYDAADTDNVNNLAHDPAYAEVLGTMLARLHAEVAEDGWILGQGPGELWGTDSNETFVPLLEDDLYGGNGDDNYILLYVLNDHHWANIHELPGGGYDTVRSDVIEMHVPDNVERAISLNVNATVFGTAMGETIIGGLRVLAGGGNDLIYAGAGDDYIDAGRGNDFIDGGVGIDTLDYSLSTSSIYMRWRIVQSNDHGRDQFIQVERIIGTNFDDTMYGTTQDDLYLGMSGVDWINGHQGSDQLDGGIGSDILIGEIGNDLLIGGAGWDRLEGGEGWDTLNGDNGNDILIGGHGRDMLRGGGHSDRFVFTSERDTTVTWPDQILDFSAGDIIDFSAIDANRNTAFNDVFRFIGPSAFSGTAGELRFDAGKLSGDTDGDGNADFAIIIWGNVTIQTLEAGLVL